MREFTISDSERHRVRALAHGHDLTTGVVLRRSAPLVLSGTNQAGIAAVAAWALVHGAAIVLRPRGVPGPAPGTSIDVAAGVTVGAAAVDDLDPPWQVAMYTSGSTRAPRAYGFTIGQLDQLATWYTSLYGLTSDSVVVTHLPVTYNFAFVAGVYLAGHLGACLHLAGSPSAVFHEAAALAPAHDRCVVLGNPVVLAEPPTFELPDVVMIDSGGAPMSAAALTHYRRRVADVREGYGLTETGSLTHFDSEGTGLSIGTVGPAVPGVDTAIVEHGGKPRIAVTTPALGAPLGPTAQNTRPGQLLTEDLGCLDGAGRLRVLGRSDDHPVAGLWPRDTLDLIGPLLGTAPALVRHPDSRSVHVRLRRPLPTAVSTAVRGLIVDRTGLPPAAVTVDAADRQLLHSHKIPRVPARSDEEPHDDRTRL